MKKIGLVGVAEATTFTGDVVVWPVVGLEMESGKSFEPCGYGGVQDEVTGSHAGGAGSGLVPGDQVMGTGGVDG